MNIIITFSLLAVCAYGMGGVGSSKSSQSPIPSVGVSSSHSNTQNQRSGFAQGIQQGKQYSQGEFDSHSSSQARKPTEVFSDADTNKDGQVSLDELAATSKAPIEETKKYLEKIDTNKDGQVSLDEFKKTLSQSYKPKEFPKTDASDNVKKEKAQPKEEIIKDKAKLMSQQEQRFAIFDTNKDGKLSADELTAKTNNPTFTNNYISHLDTDGDGQVSMDEMKKMIDKEYKNTQDDDKYKEKEKAQQKEEIIKDKAKFISQQEQRFAIFDTNKDGKLSADELTAKTNNPTFANNYISHLDTDGDGQVSMDEMKKRLN